MCEINCCLNTPTSQMERVPPDNCVPSVEEGTQVKQLSLFPEWESGCCGNATALAAGSAVVVDQSNLPTEDELGRQYLGEWWDEPTIETLQHFLKKWLRRLVGSTT